MATASVSTATKAETPLRRRMQILQRAHSLTSLNNLASADDKFVPFPEMAHSKERAVDVEHLADLSPVDYESRSESSDDVDPRSMSVEPEQVSPTFNPDSGPRRSSTPLRPKLDPTYDTSYVATREPSPMSPASRAWYEFDLAVVVALVSPVGNWLTGGDHIKNLLLVVLLIFYLHQIIEIPWALYQKARPRRRAPLLPPSLTDTAEARYAYLAASELRRLELMFLALTFLSPFFGAALLRYATSAVLGPQAVSWFSTGLFVLATGMRPWAHLVERLNQRTGELHDFVHYPNTCSQEKTVQKEVEKRLEKLEKSMTRFKAKVVHATEGVYEYVDDAVDAVEHSIRKQDKRWERHEGRVKQVEQAVVGLQGATFAGQIHPTLSSADVGSTAKAYIRWMLEHVFPAWLLSPPNKHSYNATYQASPSLATAAGGSKYPLRTFPTSTGSSPSPTSTPLETILEEDISNLNLKLKFPLLAQPTRVTSGLLFRAGHLLTMPLRAVIRMVLRTY